MCGILTIRYISPADKSFSPKTGDVDGDGESEFPTASQFSTSCGCLTTTITTTTIGTETTTTTESGSATCNEGGSFTITSTAFPEVVGCYSDTGTLTENEVGYTEAGTSDAGQNAVVAVNIGEDSAQDVSAKPERLHCAAYQST